MATDQGAGGVQAPGEQGRTPSGVDVRRLVSKALKDYQAGMSVRMVVTDAVRAALLLGATDQDALKAADERIAELERQIQEQHHASIATWEEYERKVQALEAENARLRHNEELTELAEARGAIKNLRQAALTAKENYEALLALVEAADTLEDEPVECVKYGSYTDEEPHDRYIPPAALPNIPALEHDRDEAKRLLGAAALAFIQWRDRVRSAGCPHGCVPPCPWTRRLVELGLVQA